VLGTVAERDQNASGVPPSPEPPVAQHSGSSERTARDALTQRARRARREPLARDGTLVISVWLRSTDARAGQLSFYSHPKYRSAVRHHEGVAVLVVKGSTREGLRSSP